MNRPAVFILPHLFKRHRWRPKHFCLTTAAAIAVTEPALFASRLEVVGNIRSVARLISHPLLLGLVLVIVLERKKGVDREQAHEHDYDEGGVPKCAACDS